MIAWLYDQNHVLIGLLKGMKGTEITTDLSNGDKTLSFSIHQKNRYQIFPEYYLETETDEYVVKQNDSSGSGFRKITAVLNLEELEGKPWEKFLVQEGTAKEAVDYAISGTGWQCVSAVAETKKRNISLTKANALDIIAKVREAFICESWYDTKTKTVYLADKKGSDKGAYFIRGLNLKELEDGCSSYDFVTRLVPYGADGLTISGVEPEGKTYVENYQYSSKTKAKIWEDASYTDAAELYEAAKYYLEELSRPQKSYQAKIIDLAKLKPEYSILEYETGDTITLIDGEKGIREKQRIIKTVEYPDSPEKNTCDISNTVLSFEDMQKQLQAAAECVGNITTDNGTVRGSTVDSIDVTQIIGLERYVSENMDDLTVKNLYVTEKLGAVDAVIGHAEFTQADITALNVTSDAEIALEHVTESHIDTLYASYAKFEVLESDNISALAARILELESREITTDYLEANFANINFSNVQKETVGTLLAGVGLISSATIVDGHVTGYLDSVQIDAGSITAGTLDAGNIEVTNLNAASITVGQINGQQIAPGAIDMGNLSASVSGEISTASTNAFNAVTKALEAFSNAQSAVSAAGAAQATADGKNAVFYQISAPDGTHKVNDVWYDTADANKMYYWNGSAWEAKQFGTNAIANASITNALIADATIQSAKIANLDAGKITTGTLSADRIGANTIMANKLAIGDFTNYVTVNPYAPDSMIPAAIYGGTKIGSAIGDTGSPFVLKNNVSQRYLLFCTYTPMAFSVGDELYFYGNFPNFSSTACAASVSIFSYTTSSTGSINAKGSLTFWSGTLAPTTWNKISGSVKITEDFLRGNKYFTIAIDTGTASHDIGFCDVIVKKKSTGNLIVDGAITADKLSANAVTAGKIAAAIAAGVITTDKLAANAVTAAKIASRTITADRIVSGAITANEIAAGTITADKLNVGNIFGNSAVLTTLTSQSAFINAISTNSVVVGAVNAANAAKKQVYHTAAGTSGQSGYIIFAQIKITGNYANQPFSFTIVNRSGTPSTVWITFANASSADPGIARFAKSGTANFYLSKVTTSIWNLYVQKTEAYDSMSVVGFEKGGYLGHVTVTWQNVHAGSLPANNYITATQTVATAEWCYNNDITQINGGSVAAGTVTALQIAAGAITTDKLAASAVTAAKIAAGAITADKINVTDLYAIGAKIGGFTIGTSAIYNGTNSMTSTAAGIYLGTNGIRQYNSASAYVNIQNGILTARGASLTQGVLNFLDSTGLECGKIRLATTSEFSTLGTTITGNNVKVSGNRELYLYGGTSVKIESSGIDLNADTNTKHLYATTLSGATGQHVICTYPGSTSNRETSYINTNNTTPYAITVNGKWGGTSYTSHNIASASSDVRLKSNISDSKENALDVLNKIRIRQFDWKQSGEHQDIGFIADELEEIDRHLAIGGGYDEDGCMNVKSVDTFYLMGYVVKSIQELASWKSEKDNQIQFIQQQICILQIENEMLKNEIGRLKQMAS